MIRRRSATIATATIAVVVVIAASGCGSPRPLPSSPPAAPPVSPPASPPPAANPAAANPAAPNPAAAAAAAAPALDPSALDAWTDRELGKALPSAVIALVDRTGLRWHRGVGSRDARGGPPPDRATVYRIGSITKVLTGIAILQLRDAGVLTLDDPVVRWIPELTVLGASSPPVSIRHLVTHTSGISRLGNGSASYAGQQPPDRAQLVRAVSGPLVHAPATQKLYSNAGMALAGEIVTRASVRPYRDYVSQRVLAPLGMRTAAWDRAAIPAERLAIGVGWGGAVDPPHWQLGAFEPAGGLYASLDDMAALTQLALGGAPSVLAPASLEEALRDDPLPGANGVAWVTGSLDGMRLAWHNGSTIDYTAMLAVLPEHGLAAVVLSVGFNVRLVDCAATAVLRSAATGAPPASCSDAAAARSAP